MQYFHVKIIKIFRANVHICTKSRFDEKNEQAEKFTANERTSNKQSCFDPNTTPK